VLVSALSTGQESALPEIKPFEIGDRHYRHPRRGGDEFNRADYPNRLAGMLDELVPIAFQGAIVAGVLLVVDVVVRAVGSSKFLTATCHYTLTLKRFALHVAPFVRFTL
jgi:hypothetical protein